MRRTHALQHLADFARLKMSQRLPRQLCPLLVVGAGKEHHVQVASPMPTETCDPDQPEMNKLFLITACTPQLPSTTCVTPKSAATDISEIASSSLRLCVVIKKCRGFRNASRSARSTEAQ
jgi:hypothetical protein